MNKISEYALNSLVVLAVVYLSVNLVLFSGAAYIPPIIDSQRRDHSVDSTKRELARSNERLEEFSDAGRIIFSGAWFSEMIGNTALEKLVQEKEANTD